MRHRVKNKRVGHYEAQSNAMIKNLATSIILYEKIKTTQLRGKKIKSVLEKLITTAKKSTPLNAQRYLRGFLLYPKAADKMMKELIPRYKDRTSGFVRVTPLGTRAGDAAKMVQVELL